MRPSTNRIPFSPFRHKLISPKVGLLFLWAIALGIAPNAHARKLDVYLQSPLPAPAQRAFEYLEEAFRAQGVEYSVDTAYPTNLIVGITGQSPYLDQVMAEKGLSVPEAPESLLIAPARLDDGGGAIIAGRDAIGLAYALYEFADFVRSGLGSDIVPHVEEVRESPFLPVRSVQTQLLNEDVERSWYRSEEYWTWFFQMLAHNRFNQYTITLGHNTNYMVPPYAWLFEVPEYPEVRVTGMSDEARAENLRLFQRIGEIAQEYGVALNVGLWTQLPVVAVREGLDYGPSLVENLPESVAGGDYCAKGLRKLLELCPGIKGVQLRMNLESGIPNEQQEAYYQTQFEAIANCGRPVRLDMRYKSLSQRTVDLANEAGLDLTVSTKYWCEHMGLPFHPTWQDPAYSESRYGYGAMLHYPRNYRVVYRLWNVGTSKLFVWGDPDYAARFARSCTLGGGEGFEIFTPLSNKGYGNESGDWRVFANESDEYYTWEQERYWAFYLAFGRWGYNPDTPDTVWARAFKERFGSVSEDVDTSYRAASQILPLITATTQYSAANWRWWPEMETGMHLDAYRAIQPADYSQFYAIAPFPTRQHWRAEDWAARHSAFVEDAIAGNLNSKWTPIQVADRLNELGQTATDFTMAIEFFSIPEPVRPEFESTARDFRALAHLAQYHALKKRAAVQLEFFRLNGEKGRLVLAWNLIQSAQLQWKLLVDATDGRYSDNLVFGFSKEHNSDFASRLHEHTGHWKDRMGDVQRDVDFVADLMQKNDIPLDIDVGAAARLITRYPGETSRKEKPEITHDRLTSATPGQDLAITANVKSAEPLRDVSVYFRPVDQTRPWKRIPMQPGEEGSWSATILGGEIDPRFDFQYYLEARVATGGTFWPRWVEETPYVVVPVKR